MKLLRLCITSLLLFFLTGCFQVTTVVRVNPDGSGTVEDRILISKKIAAAIEEAMTSFGGDGGKGKPFDLFEPDQLKKKASSMGKGVSYLSGERVETSDYKGYLAKYRFRDINTLKLAHQSGTPSGNNASKAPLADFHFKKGPKATMTIVLPKAKTANTISAAPEAGTSHHVDIPPEESDEKTKELMEMFMGMKFALAVEVNGNIVSTNATYRDGNRLTVFDFDLAKLGNATPSELEKLSQMKNSSLDDVKELVKNFPGVKFEMNDKLTVFFEK